MASVIKVKRSEVSLNAPTSGALAVGEIAINTADNKLFIKDSTGTIKEIGGGAGVSLHDVLTTNPSSTESIHLNGSTIIFEGATADAFETTITATDPLQDNTLTLPDQSGLITTENDALAFSVVFGG